jgi:hypothetical protein
MDVSGWIARTYVGSWLLLLENTVALDGYEDLRLVEWRRVCLIGNKLMWNERNWIVCGKLKMLFGTNKLCVMVVWEPTLGCC